MPKNVESRIFVPLAADPYAWFASGDKFWELRRAKGPFSVEHIRVGRYVELRRGYSDRRSAIFGIITNVVHKSSIREVLELVPYSQVVPIAQSKEDAVKLAEGIVGRHRSFICFKIRELTDKDYSRRIYFKRRYLRSVVEFEKFTTIRRANAISVGPYVFDFEGELLQGFVTKIVSKSQARLTDEDARSDGFRSVSELNRALLEFYPETTTESEFSICHFNLVNRCQNQYKLNY